MIGRKTWTRSILADASRRGKSLRRLREAPNVISRELKLSPCGISVAAQFFVAGARSTSKKSNT